MKAFRPLVRPGGRSPSADYPRRTPCSFSPLPATVVLASGPAVVSTSCRSLTLNLETSASGGIALIAHLLGGLGTVPRELLRVGYSAAELSDLRDQPEDVSHRRSVSASVEPPTLLDLSQLVGHYTPSTTGAPAVPPSCQVAMVSFPPPSE